MVQSSYIQCKCGSCRLVLADDTPFCHLACACEDCANFLRFLYSSDGSVPIKVVHAYYLKADILEVHGIDCMESLRLSSDSETIRTYCSECFSVIGVYHQLMRDNVFASWPDFCEISYNLEIPLSAYMYVTDPIMTEKLIVGNIPVIGSLYSKSEFKKFMSIVEVENTFKSVHREPIGISYRQFLYKLPQPKTVFSSSKNKVRSAEHRSFD